jgi:uncharacterized radical SAM protein YgiQ
MKNSIHTLNDWLPTSLKEVEGRGWKELDVILFSGDSYVDHPSFGIAVIGRVLEKLGLKVAIVPQPNWQDDLRDFKKLGRPRLFFGVSSGSMDSMVNHYTANRRLRSDDAYTPGRRSGFRPDYAAYVYAQNLKKIFPDIPIILGGIEASLRRFTHYDYWSDKLKPSILAESNADMLVYGMAEKTIRKIALELMSGKKIDQLTDIPQTAFITDHIQDPGPWEKIKISLHEDCLKNKKTFAETFRVIEEESNSMSAKQILQQYGNKTIVVNPPEELYTEAELDEIFELPFTREPHPRYRDKPIPAYEMIRHSINIHRGCFGGCSFCTISAHQGKFIQSRSEKSILNELDKISLMADFKGQVSDLGGPSANMYKMQGNNLDICKKCKRYSCIYPSICNNLNTDHTPLIQLYEKSRKKPSIKKITIGSGIRYDLLIGNPHKQYEQSYKKYLETLFEHHVSGRMKVAPEHTSESVLKLMRKPSFILFEKLKLWFDTLNKKTGMNQQLIPYFISNHPGCKLEDMADLAVKTKELRYHLEQVQGFTPTPMTLSSVMYYSGIDPYTSKPVYSVKTKEEQQQQQSFFFWYKKENHQMIRSLLQRIGRADLISKILGR